MRLVKERAVFVSDLWSLSSFFFEAPVSFDEKAVKKQWKETTPGLMKDLIEFLSTFDEETSSNSVEQRRY